MKNAKLAENTKRMQRYQEEHSVFLSTPKRKTAKFTNKTAALKAKTERRTTFTDRCFAI